MNATSKAAYEHYQGVRDAAKRMLRQMREDGEIDAEEFIFQLLRRSADGLALARDYCSPALWDAITEARISIGVALDKHIDVYPNEGGDDA